MNSSRTTDSIITTALEWVVELEDRGMDPLSPYPTMSAKLQAFAQWFLESPRHQDAFIEAMAICGVSRRFDVEHRISVERLKAAPDSNVVQFNGEISARRESERRSLPEAPRRRRFLAAACASVLVLLTVPLVLFVLRARPEPSSWPAYYSAGIGERYFVPLEDGSTIELNTRSRVEVEITSHTRRVTLLAGEAVFNVRHDDARPFIVVSNGLVIQDVGTTFAVRQTSGATTVSVLEGRVAISTTGVDTAGKAAPLPTIVEAEHSASVTASGRHLHLQVRDVSAAELARTLAWRDGHLVFSGETLAQVVTELNRYHRRQIQIVDPSIARLTVGGVFTTTDLDGFLATLQFLFDVRSVPASGDADTLELTR